MENQRSPESTLFQRPDARSPKLTAYRVPGFAESTIRSRSGPTRGGPRGVQRPSPASAGRAVSNRMIRNAIGRGVRIRVLHGTPASYGILASTAGFRGEQREDRQSETLAEDLMGQTLAGALQLVRGEAALER